ncbi:HAD-like domain-containing protein [Lactarius indigo]|nr:HAD-like domain-containing protein [Lactarius indigo]
MLFEASRALRGARSCHGWRFLSAVAGARADSRHLPSLGIAFDIDGVLLHGARVLSEAQRALSILEGNNRFNSEEDRSRKLTEQLGFEITTSNFMQAHAILKPHAHKYANKPVLVLGGRRDALRRVAEDYGLKHVYTTLDVKAWNPDVWPFYDLTPEERASAKPVDFSTTPISAIFVFHDPRNWALDVQIMMDVVHAPPVELVFCNPDLQWRSEFPRPRLGQGAFREAFQAVHQAVTGAPYPYTQFGKPTTHTYDFAEKMLRARMAELHGPSVMSDIQPRLSLYADNPESGWSSILVRTGVYDPADGPPAENVEAAVYWAIEREIAQMA